MLKKYDNKKVRIQCIDGNTYEGLSEYNSKDYDYHEFGRDEESLQLMVYLFFKSDIKKIEIIDEYSDKYGLLEKEIVEDEIFIEEVFESECNEDIYRLLLCIKDKFNELKDKDEVIKQLNYLLKYNKDKEIHELVKEILHDYGKN